MRRRADVVVLPAEDGGALVDLVNQALRVPWHFELECSDQGRNHVHPSLCASRPAVNGGCRTLRHRTISGRQCCKVFNQRGRRTRGIVIQKRDAHQFPHVREQKFLNAEIAMAT